MSRQLALEIDEDLFEIHEWIEGGDEGERAALIPAEELAGLPVVQLEADETEELAIERLTRWYARA